MSTFFGVAQRSGRHLLFDSNGGSTPASVHAHLEGRRVVSEALDVHRGGMFAMTGALASRANASAMGHGGTFTTAQKETLALRAHPTYLQEVTPN
jgi:hypothetical protein